MKKLTIILFCLFIYASNSFAIEELRRVPVRDGYDMTVQHLGRTSTLYFDKAATKADISDRLAKKAASIEAGISQEVYEKQYPSTFSRDEIEKILIEKKHIEVGEKLEDLKVNEITAVAK